MTSALVGEAAISRAISNIKSRSERQADLDVLQRTYVETGVLPQIDNANSQILYGRRGTGKSHVLKVLIGTAEARAGVLPVYVDVRLLGSAHLMTDTALPLASRAVSVFRDLLSALQLALLEAATRPDSAHTGGLEEVSRFADALTSASASVEMRKVSGKEGSTTGSGSKAGVAVAAFPNPSVGFNLTDEKSATRSAEQLVEYEETLRETVVFAEVAKLLDDALSAMGVSELLLVIDEWTSIPWELQPFVAEFLKRSMLPASRVCVKIASLEYRSNFTLTLGPGNPVGFELGPDVAANLDLDDYYVYDRNPHQVEAIFLELLHRHIESELPAGYLTEQGINSAAGLRTRLFTESSTFLELVRAGEGVVRDFLGIFTSAYFRAVRGGRQKIDMNSVEEAARDWYETDKSTVLTDAQRDVLHRIITEVIGKRQAKMFLVSREDSAHPMIKSLFDARLVHLISRGYSDKENPGIRYNIFSLDYGTYVDLKRTKAAPGGYLPGTEPEGDVTPVVPFADKRSIRRIILDATVLEETATTD